MKKSNASGIMAGMFSVVGMYLACLSMWFFYQGNLLRGAGSFIAFWIATFLVKLFHEARTQRLK